MTWAPRTSSRGDTRSSSCSRGSWSRLATLYRSGQWWWPCYHICVFKRNFASFLITNISVTSSIFQARSSYLPNEVLWGYRFVNLLTFKHSASQYKIDYSAFNSVYKTELSPLSQKVKVELIFVGNLSIFSTLFRTRYPMVTRQVMTRIMTLNAPVLSPPQSPSVLTTPPSPTQPRPSTTAGQQHTSTPAPPSPPRTPGHTTTSTSVTMARSIVSRCFTWSDVFLRFSKNLTKIWYVISENAQNQWKCTKEILSLWIYLC